MAIKSRFQRRMARHSRKQQRRRQDGVGKVPYSRFPSSERSSFSFMNEEAEPYRSPQRGLTNLLDQDLFGELEPSRPSQYSRNLENQTEGGPGTRGDGSFCSGMDEDNCNAASLACAWETRADTGSSFCKRRPYGAKKGRVAESLGAVEAREEARLKQAREQYKADAEMKRLFEDEPEPAPVKSKSRTAARSVPPPPPPPPMARSYGSYVPPSMPSSRSVPPPPPMPFLPTMGSRSAPLPTTVSPPAAAPKKSRTAAKSPAKSAPESSPINLYAMTTEELKKIARELGIKVAASNKSADIIKKIEAKMNEV
jgi:hypothetical protein